MPSDTFLWLHPHLHLSPLASHPSLASILSQDSRRQPAAMKTALALLVFIPLAFHSHALKCHTCVASSEDDCNRQGSTSCPQYADACSTITGPNTVMKSCTYNAFCDKARSSSSGAKMECCFGDDCNGPHRSHSHGDHHRNGAGALATSPVMLITALLLRVLYSQL
nr:uncharacterized protein si:ch211-113d22.2 [Nothobranchius furzeri]